MRWNRNQNSPSTQGSPMRQIFETTVLKGKELKNRLVRSATWENLADDTGHMTEELSLVYEELAQGGVGMIITGYASSVKRNNQTPR
jgi:2,4-dienoyl-CoA reductase-like NADH-dependent reductase (Old Yellow Enzyme family)